MSTDKFSLSLIATICRNLKLTSSLSKEEILLILGGQVSQEEIEFVKRYKTIMKSPEIAQLILQYARHDDGDMLKYLESINYTSFLVPMTYLGTSDRKEKIMTFFYISSLRTNLPTRVITHEQQEVIRLRSFTIVNAGPGTGKTTCGCIKAFTLQHEGVIFSSYTNAAVKEIKVRMYEFPINKKKILFSTIDSLAAKICHGISESYDENIRNAITIIEKRGRLDLDYRHVILDESQDIDNLRFELIAKMYINDYFDSVTIFGDPRQKINSNAGGWYNKIWVDSQSGYCNIYSNRIKVKRIGFTYSQRFHNKNVLDLVNDLSLRRPEIHHKLESNNIIFSSTPITLYNVNIESNFLRIISTLISDGTKYSDIMVISPSIEADNKTSMSVKKLESLLRYNNIPCKIDSQGSYHSDGILFSTIHSAKGKEADYVFIVGMNNYTNSFSMIPFDEAESLIYVAHSRARKGIIYLFDQPSISLPRGIKESDIHCDDIIGQIRVHSEDQFCETKKLIVSSLCKDHNLNKLLTINNYRLISDQSEFNFEEMPERNEPYDFYGILVGMMVSIFCTMELPHVIKIFILNKFIVVEDKDYEEMKRNDILFFNGTIFGETDEKVYIKESQFVLLQDIKLIYQKDINELTIEDFYNLVVFLVQIQHGYKIFHKSLFNPDLIPYCKNIASEIVNRFGIVIGTEVNVKMDNIVGSIDILTETSIIEIKTKQEVDESDFLQVHLYNILLPGRDYYLLNLNRKICRKVRSNRIDDSWNYILSKYIQIYVSQIEINIILGKRLKKDSFNRENIFCIDTEFNTSNLNKQESIFEISIYNYNDPYSSIISIVNNGEINRSFCKEWLEVSDRLYDNSPNIDFIKLTFENLRRIYNEVPTLFYYVADVDISWSYGTNNIDISKKINRKGFYESSHKICKLVDLYNSAVNFISMRGELKHHTALSDTIMLYEIIKILF